MNTARDLAIVALDLARDQRVEQGELSLALAAAEVFDLLDAGALTLAEDRMAPNAQAPTGDRLLDEAATALVRQEPYESVEDWLWRRGRGLSAAYAEDLEQTGTMSKSRGFRLPLRAARTVPGDPAARQRAEDRWTAPQPGRRGGPPPARGWFGTARPGTPPTGPRPCWPRSATR
ncbi:GPP34 family phosphoprotein [Streptomyces sp. NPDC059374]|uniref:GPP34 family phosphoprotein n=1 Tax=Streptomyces sp. NPDC059374 TaxID=3346814 RepID=UPI0036BB2B6E